MTGIDTSSNRNVLTNGVLLFVVFGFGLGITVILIEQFGSWPFQSPQQPPQIPTERTSAASTVLSETTIYLITYSVIFAPLIAILPGFVCGRSVHETTEAVMYATVVGFVGGSIFVVLFSGLAFVALSSQLKALFGIGGLDIIALTLNGLIGGFGSAIIAGGTAWVRSRIASHTISD